MEEYDAYVKASPLSSALRYATRASDIVSCHAL